MVSTLMVGRPPLAPAEMCLTMATLVLRAALEDRSSVVGRGDLGGDADGAGAGGEEGEEALAGESEAFSVAAPSPSVLTVSLFTLLVAEHRLASSLFAGGDSALSDKGNSLEASLRPNSRSGIDGSPESWPTIEASFALVCARTSCSALRGRDKLLRLLVFVPGLWMLFRTVPLPRGEEG